MALPGAGVVCGVVDKLYSCAKLVHILLSSNTVNEKRRAVQPSLKFSGNTPVNDPQKKSIHDVVTTFTVFLFHSQLLKV